MKEGGTTTAKVGLLLENNNNKNGFVWPTAKNYISKISHLEFINKISMCMQVSEKATEENDNLCLKSLN